MAKYIYIYICMYASKYRWVCVSIIHITKVLFLSVCVCACTHICRYACMHKCVYGYIYGCTYTIPITIFTQDTIPCWRGFWLLRLRCLTKTTHENLFCCTIHGRNSPTWTNNHTFFLVRSIRKKSKLKQSYSYLYSWRSKYLHFCAFTCLRIYALTLPEHAFVTTTRSWKAPQRYLVWRYKIVPGIREKASCNRIFVSYMGKLKIPSSHFGYRREGGRERGVTTKYILKPS